MNAANICNAAINEFIGMFVLNKTICRVTPYRNFKWLPLDIN